VTALARWEGGEAERVGASRSGLLVKWRRKPTVRGRGEQKETGESQVRGKQGYTGAKRKVYSCFSRARGLNSISLFFY
jgi:hypothetical protein